MNNLFALKRDIVEVGRRTYVRGYVASNDGNISARIDDRRVVITPTGVSKGFMHPDDLIIVDMAMPDLNGFELIERIKRMRDDFQVIYVSGYISPRKYLPYAKTLVEGKNLISRPFRLYSLLQMVDNAVRRRV